MTGSESDLLWNLLGIIAVASAYLAHFLSRDRKNGKLCLGQSLSYSRCEIGLADKPSLVARLREGVVASAKYGSAKGAL